jgi:hypothetical protein
MNRNQIRNITTVLELGFRKKLNNAMKSERWLGVIHPKTTSVGSVAGHRSLSTTYYEYTLDDDDLCCSVAGLHTPPWGSYAEACDLCMV